MIKAIVLDDKLPALTIVREFCSKIDFIRLEKSFSKPEEALRHLKKFPVDLLFIGIQMQTISGIKFSKLVPQKNTMIIFMSAHSQYAVEGFNLGVVDFLLKPFTFERFSQAANRAMEYFKFQHQNKNAEQKHLFIRADYSLIKIPIADILYIESLDDYLKIHLNNHKTVITKMTMKTILEKLPPEEFIRVHRSFIVPISRIKKIRKRVISLPEADIPIGLSYDQSFKSILNSSKYSTFSDI